LGRGGFLIDIPQGFFPDVNRDVVFNDVYHVVELYHFCIILPQENVWCAIIGILPFFFTREIFHSHQVKVIGKNWKF